MSDKEYKAPCTTQPRVLLLADAHLHLVWSLPRIIHRAGAHLVLMAPANQCFRHSRFVDEWVDAPPAGCDAVAAQLTKHLADHHYDLVVHASPSVVEVLSRSARPASMEWLLPEVARALATKTAFHPWALSHNLPVPPGRVCRSLAEAGNWVTERGLSVIKCDALHGGDGVWQVANTEEVRSVWPKLNHPAAVVLQKFIHGPVGCTELMLQHGRVVGWFASIKERSVTPFGASIMRRLVNPPGMADLVQHISTATEFHGLCGFDWILDEATGRVVVLEFHPRVTSGFCWGRIAGVDVSAALRDLLSGRPAELRAPKSAKQLALAPLCCYFPAHFWWALTEQRGDLKYWLPCSHAVSWRNVPFDDPKLLGGVLAFALRNLSRRHFPRLRSR